MKLSDETLSVLKNFSAINPNLVVNEGSEIKTISVAKNILAKASVPEAFPKSFGIYDLNEFLGAVNMFPDADLSFGDASCVINFGGRKINYYFSDPSILTTPSKDITMPKSEIKFRLNEDDLDALRKAASTFGVQGVMVCGEEGGSGITIKVTDPANPTSNSFELDVNPEGLSRPDGAFQMVFNIGNFKFAAGDYDVSLSSKLISNFKNTNGAIEYWVALEKSSVFNG